MYVRKKITSWICAFFAVKCPCPEKNWSFLPKKCPNFHKLHRFHTKSLPAARKLKTFGAQFPFHTNFTPNPCRLRGNERIRRTSRKTFKYLKVLRTLPWVIIKYLNVKAQNVQILKNTKESPVGNVQIFKGQNECIQNLKNYYGVSRG